MSDCLPIKGFSNYLVSSDGHLINKTTGRTLRGCRNKAGYIHTNIINDEGVTKTVYLHRLVAEAFIPNKRGLLEVNHKDGDKSNNKASNLEWVTRVENLTHAITTGLRKTLPVVATHCKTGEKLYFKSLKEGAEYFKIAISHISLCCRGHVPHAHGYYWSYQDGGGDE